MKNYAYDITLLSTADWDHPFWTNKQHVAVQLAQLGCRILYVESIGLRKPSANKHDAVRIGRRLLKIFRPPRQVKDNLWVWSPVVIPLNHIKVFRILNRILLSIGLAWWRKLLRIEPNLLWTYNPLTLEFFDLKKFRCIVYHCVDEIKAQPGMPVKLLEKSEKLLCQKADVIFTTSIRLNETRKKWNQNTYYFPNVADFSHFSKALKPETPIPDDLQLIPSPRIGFIGAINQYKLDFSLIQKIAESRPQWSLILIGKVGEGDPWIDMSDLKKFPNLYLLGPRPYRLLPNYLKGFDVAILPNQINEYTDAMFPMKFFEYMAAGKPIVSVKLKSLQEFYDHIKIAVSPDDFLIAVQDSLDGDDVDCLNARLKLAESYTYRARTLSMLSLIMEACSTG